MAKLEEIAGSLDEGAPEIGDGQTEAKFAAIESQMLKLEVGYNQERMVAKVGKAGCKELSKLMKNYYENGVTPSEDEIKEARFLDMEELMKPGVTDEAKATYHEAKDSLIAAVKTEKMMAKVREAGEKAVGKLLAGMKALNTRVASYKIYEPTEETQVADAIDERMALLEDTRELDTMLAELDATSEFVSSDAQAEIAQARIDAVKGAKKQIAKATKAPKKKGNKNEYADLSVTDNLLAFRAGLFGEGESLFSEASFPSLDVSLSPRTKKEPKSYRPDGPTVASD